MIPGLDIILGGVTGLIGSVTTSITNYKMTKLNNDHKEKMVSLESEAMKLEAEMQIQISRTETEGKVEIAEVDAFKTSQEVGNKEAFSDKWIDKMFSVTGWVKYFAIPFGVLIACGLAFVDFLRGFVRPASTIYLLGVTTWITYMSWQILQKNGMSITGQEALDLFKQVTSIVIYLTTSSLSWWFGNRVTEKFYDKISKKG